MHIAYIVSRFPHFSETFIARELLVLEKCGTDELELLSLFPRSTRPCIRRQRRSSTGSYARTRPKRSWRSAGGPSVGRCGSAQASAS